MKEEVRHKLTISKIESMIKKVYKDSYIGFKYTFHLDASCYNMEPCFSFKYSLIEHYIKVWKDGVCTIGFEVPSVWCLEDFVSTNDNLGEDASDSDIMFDWFLKGLYTLSSSKRAMVLKNLDIDPNTNIALIEGMKDQITDDEWYREYIVDDIIYKMQAIILDYKCKRVVGGACTTPNNIYPVLQIDFNSDRVYMINRSKNRYEVECKVGDLTLEMIKLNSNIATKSFGGSVTNDHWDYRIKKLTVQKL